MEKLKPIKSLKQKLHAQKSRRCMHNNQLARACFMIMVSALLAGFLLSCTTPENPAGKAQNYPQNLYGYYEFDENIFTSPLSSFLPFKGHMPFYEISENGLTIIGIQNDSVQTIPGSFEKKDLDREQLKKMFPEYAGAPDIDQYKTMLEYAAFTAEGGSEYRLYGADHELWLVNVHPKSFIWSIYRLHRTEDLQTGPDGQLIVPTEAPYVYQKGFQLELCSGADVLEPVFVSDKESMNLLKDLIAFYDAQTVRAENVDIFSVGEYFRFYDSTGQEDTLYYVFLNPAIDEKPQMFTNKDARARTGISTEGYETLYRLWQSLMPLPDEITVLSGEHSISAMIFHQQDEVKLESLKEHVPWLNIQSDTFLPFSVYYEGVKIYGSYEVYDAETMAPLDFIHPSGLEPQTYLFQNATPGRSYIIVMSAKHMKIIFGTTLPH